jgi:predicted TIM-barrel fold metal-dependent hydrolase
MLVLPMPVLDDPEGDSVPAHVLYTVDAHVHLFPDPLFHAIWQWFDHYAWPVRYRLTARDIVDFLLTRGVGHVVALHYAHAPGIARSLNRFMADISSAYPQVTGTATVFPGEPDAKDILKEAAEMGLCGVKLHAHVQRFDMDSAAMHEIYQSCATNRQPLIMHVGPEPMNPAYDYGCDLRELCKGEKVERILKQYPDLNLCVPHLGADEFALYKRLLEQYDNVWLDTTMALADYLPMENVPRLADLRADRVMYGTDFPNIPYAWDRELKHICNLGLSHDSLELILGGNARTLFSLPARAEG